MQQTLVEVGGEAVTVNGFLCFKAKERKTCFSSETCVHWQEYGKKLKTSFVSYNMFQMFDMIDLAFNNLQQQNKDLRRTVNELSSKINKLVFHERKEESNNNEATR